MITLIVMATWTIIDLGGSPQGRTLNGIAICPGRNDGMNRVYAGNHDFHVYEFSYNGSSWD